MLTTTRVVVNKATTIQPNDVVEVEWFIGLDVRWDPNADDELRLTTGTGVLVSRLPFLHAYSDTCSDPYKIDLKNAKGKLVSPPVPGGYVLSLYDRHANRRVFTMPFRVVGGGHSGHSSAGAAPSIFTPPTLLSYEFPHTIVRTKGGGRAAIPVTPLARITVSFPPSHFKQYAGHTNHVLGIVNPHRGDNDGGQARGAYDSFDRIVRVPRELVYHASCPEEAGLIIGGGGGGKDTAGGARSSNAGMFGLDPSKASSGRTRGRSFSSSSSSSSSSVSSSSSRASSAGKQKRGYYSYMNPWYREEEEEEEGAGEGNGGNKKDEEGAEGSRRTSSDTNGADPTTIAFSGSGGARGRRSSSGGGSNGACNSANWARTSRAEAYYNSILAEGSPNVHGGGPTKRSSAFSPAIADGRPRNWAGEDFLDDPFALTEHEGSGVGAERARLRIATPSLQKSRARSVAAKEEMEKGEQVILTGRPRTQVTARFNVTVDDDEDAELDMTVNTRTARAYAGIGNASTPPTPSFGQTTSAGARRRRGESGSTSAIGRGGSELPMFNKNTIASSNIVNTQLSAYRTESAGSAFAFDSRASKDGSAPFGSGGVVGGAARRSSLLGYQQPLLTASSIAVAEDDVTISMILPAEPGVYQVRYLTTPPCGVPFTVAVSEPFTVERPTNEAHVSAVAEWQQSDIAGEIKIDKTTACVNERVRVHFNIKTNCGRRLTPLDSIVFYPFGRSEQINHHGGIFNIIGQALYEGVVEIPAPPNDGHYEVGYYSLNAQHVVAVGEAAVSVRLPIARLYLTLGLGLSEGTKATNRPVYQIDSGDTVPFAFEVEDHIFSKQDQIVVLDDLANKVATASIQTIEYGEHRRHTSGKKSELVGLVSGTAEVTIPMAGKYSVHYYSRVRKCPVAQLPAYVQLRPAAGRGVPLPLATIRAVGTLPMNESLTAAVMKDGSDLRPTEECAQDCIVVFEEQERDCAVALYPDHPATVPGLYFHYLRGNSHAQFTIPSLMNLLESRQSGFAMTSVDTNLSSPFSADGRSSVDEHDQLLTQLSNQIDPLSPTKKRRREWRIVLRYMASLPGHFARVCTSEAIVTLRDPQEMRGFVKQQLKYVPVHDLALATHRFSADGRTAAPIARPARNLLTSPTSGLYGLGTRDGSRQLILAGGMSLPPNNGALTTVGGHHHTKQSIIHGQQQHQSAGGSGGVFLNFNVEGTEFEGAVLGPREATTGCAIRVVYHITNGAPRSSDRIVLFSRDGCRTISDALVEYAVPCSEGAATTITGATRLGAKKTTLTTLVRKDDQSSPTRRRLGVLGIFTTSTSGNPKSCRSIIDEGDAPRFGEIYLNPPTAEGTYAVGYFSDRHQSVVLVGAPFMVSGSQTPYASSPPALFRATAVSKSCAGGGSMSSILSILPPPPPSSPLLDASRPRIDFSSSPSGKGNGTNSNNNTISPALVGDNTHPSDIPSIPSGRRPTTGAECDGDASISGVGVSGSPPSPTSVELQQNTRQQRLRMRLFSNPADSVRSPRTRILIVAVGSVHLNKELKGPLNDLELFREATTEFFFKGSKAAADEHTMILSEGRAYGPDSTPTAHNIRKAIRWLLHNAQERDHLVFYYTGCGTVIEGDNVILPCDCDTSSRFIPYRELHDTLLSAAPKGTDVTVFIDACYWVSLRDVAVESQLALPESVAANAISRQRHRLGIAPEAPWRALPPSVGSSGVIHPLVTEVSLGTLDPLGYFLPERFNPIVSIKDSAGDEDGGGETFSRLHSYNSDMFTRSAAAVLRGGFVPTGEAKHRLIMEACSGSFYAPEGAWDAFNRHTGRTVGVFTCSLCHVLKELAARADEVRWWEIHERVVREVAKSPYPQVPRVVVQASEALDRLVHSAAE